MHSNRCTDDLGRDTNAGCADPHSGSGNQLPGLGAWAAAKRARRIAANFAPTAPPAARAESDIAVEFAFDRRDVNVQVVEDPSGSRPRIECKNRQKVLGSHDLTTVAVVGV